MTPQDFNTFLYDQFDRIKTVKQNQTLTNIDAMPVGGTYIVLPLFIDFGRHGDVFEALKSLADEQLRTVEAQALYMLRQMLAEGCDDGRRSL